MKLDFGRYKGQEMKDVPVKYLLFLAGFRLNGTRRDVSTLKASQWVNEFRPEIRQLAIDYLNGRCWHCNSKLVPIGHQRVNGTAHEDWSSRILHKKCWKELKNQEKYGLDSDDD